eukprot:sb/3473301/
MIIISAWSPVVRGTNIPFDLESTPLQIKTDSAAGSEDQKIAVIVYTADVTERFYCYRDQLGTVLPLFFYLNSLVPVSLSTIFLFLSVCPGFTVDGSVQGSWNDTDQGQTVTINCQEKHVRDGSSERTCNSGGEWNKDAPLCRQLGKYLYGDNA